MDDVAGVVLVLFPQVLKDPDLLLCLSVEPLLISHHFEGNMLVCFVIVHFQHLPEAAFAYHLEDLVAVGYVVVWDMCVGTLFIIISTIVWSANDTRPLLSIRSNEVYLRVVENLMMFIWSKLVHVELHDLLRCCHHCLWFGRAILLCICIMFWTLQCAISGGVPCGWPYQGKGSHSIDMDTIHMAIGLHTTHPIGHSIDRVGLLI